MANAPRHAKQTPTSDQAQADYERRRQDFVRNQYTPAPEYTEPQFNPYDDSPFFNGYPANQGYMDAAYYNQGHARKKGGILSKILKTLLFLLIVVVVAFFVYTGRLDSILSLASGESDAVRGALTSAVAGEPYYVLVLGSDKRDGESTVDRVVGSGEGERTDVMILVRVDAKNNLITMLSIPRDTPVVFDDGHIGKINECYTVGGAAYSIRKVSELTGVPIAHIVEVRISDFEKVVDSLGGITMDVPLDFAVEDADTGEMIYVSAGEQKLNGKQAQAVARARHEYGDDQDANRQSSVRDLAKAVLRETFKRPFYEVPGAVLNVAECVDTDLKTFDLIGLGVAFAGGPGTTMYSGSGPTIGGPRADADGQWLCYDNPQGWANVMAVVDSGGDPSTVDTNSTAIIP